MLTFFCGRKTGGKSHPVATFWEIRERAAAGMSFSLEGKYFYEATAIYGETKEDRGGRRVMPVGEEVATVRKIGRYDIVYALFLLLFLFDPRK